ncbi:hypothetical protein ACRAWD_02845 [Caulobacter segnis]
MTGGAIVLDTRASRPSATRSGSVRVGAGDYSLRQFDGRVDIPMGQDLALRLAGSPKQHDGYGRDRLTGRPGGRSR